jgi:GNAT superfamily N-acetyltransferase
LQTLSEITAELHSRHFLKAVAGGSIRGSVQAHLENGTCYLGRLIVHPAYQNLGLGTQLLSKIAGCFPDAQGYELFTGHLSERNLYLYRKLGYLPIRRDPVSEKLTLVFLEKKDHSRKSRGLFA